MITSLSETQTYIKGIEIHLQSVIDDQVPVCGLDPDDESNRTEDVMAYKEHGEGNEAAEHFADELMDSENPKDDIDDGPWTPDQIDTEYEQMKQDDDSSTSNKNPR